MSSNLSIEVVVKVDSTGQGGALLSFATTELFMIFIDSSYYLQIFYNNTWYAPSPSLLLETDVWNKVGVAARPLCRKGRSIHTLGVLITATRAAIDIFWCF